ncbi:hypothetical protein Gotri_006868 [Gossypium trilobum]|uniref:Uncharacterized protein n=1 Tax=Gossypium trilobum TaxID=34281 RepID=A0A7J9FQ49_9ROSI|nr:hypothetical protein [Gossypium trilobum]
MQWLAQCEFAYKGNNYKKKVPQNTIGGGVRESITMSLWQVKKVPNR